MRSVVVTFGQPTTNLPWWWKEIQKDIGLCPLDYKRVSYRNKRSKQISTFELPVVLFKMLFVFLELRRKYDFIFTFECDLTTFSLSFWQSILFSRKPKHVVLQFIMREKTGSLLSQLKYIFMKAVFSSIYMAICSASEEAAYYKQAFHWPDRKLGFVPYHTSNKFLEFSGNREEEYVISAGRIFRDFKTLIDAVHLASFKTIIIAPKNYVDRANDHNVEIMEEIPSSRYEQLLRSAMVVVVTLEDRKISAGQTVLLDAMALGKPVIATKTAATTDYIRHGVNGLLVDPVDSQALRKAIDQLMREPTLRKRLGAAARQDVLDYYLPHHYTRGIRSVLANQNRGNE